MRCHPTSVGSVEPSQPSPAQPHNHPGGDNHTTPTTGRGAAHSSVSSSKPPGSTTCPPERKKKNRPRAARRVGARPVVKEGRTEGGRKRGSVTWVLRWIESLEALRMSWLTGCRSFGGIRREGFLRTEDKHHEGSLLAEGALQLGAARGVTGLQPCLEVELGSQLDFPHPSSTDV